jgi:hypothetical protein
LYCRHIIGNFDRESLKDKLLDHNTFYRLIRPVRG